MVTKEKKYNTGIQIGEILKIIREKKGIKKGFVSNKAGISRDYLRKVEQGISNPSLDIFCNICKAYELEPNKVLRIKDASSTGKEINIEKDVLELLWGRNKKN